MVYYNKLIGYEETFFNLFEFKMAYYIHVISDIKISYHIKISHIY